MDKDTLFMELYREKYGDKITRDIAERIVEDMAVTDGTDRTTGERWNWDEAKAAAEKVGVDWSNISKCEWYLVLNMMYSDYFKVAKKHGLNNDFFIEMALEWFNDVDGKENKTFFYFINQL